MFEETVESAVLGLVVGDALGVPVEFMSREELAHNPVTGMREHGTHDQPAGTWSDDSSMMLCLLESLTNGLDYQDMMLRFLRWEENGYMTARGNVFDIGAATKQALFRFAQGVSPMKCGGSGVFDNGNGSLMRILPVALYLHRTMGSDFPDMEEAYTVIHNISRLTHAHPVSLMGCGIYCSAANELLCGRRSPKDIQYGINRSKAMYSKMAELQPYLKEYQRVDVSILRSLLKSEINSDGYVVHTLEAALWCLLRCDSYCSCLLEAVNLGDDSDTVGAVAGGLAGIRYGMDGIPKDWLDALAKREKIESMCRNFAAAMLLS